MTRFSGSTARPVNRRPDPTPPTDAEVRAIEAVRVFRNMLPNLNAYARAVAGRAVRIELTDSNGHSDHNTIYFRPPIELGDRTEHDITRCHVRQPDGLQSCYACRIRERVMAVIYHEIAHIANGSFVNFNTKDVETVQREAIPLWGTSVLHYRNIAQTKLRDLQGYTASLKDDKGRDFMNLLNTVHPWAPKLWNAIEDARVNEVMFKARPGVRTMFDALMQQTRDEGIPEPGGPGKIFWRDCADDYQVILGVNAKLAGYDYTDWFRWNIETALDDIELNEILEDFSFYQDSRASAMLALRVCKRLNELGFLRLPEVEDPIENPKINPPEPEKGESDERDTTEDSDTSEESDRSDVPNDSGTDEGEGDVPVSDESDAGDPPSEGSDEAGLGDEGEAEDAPSSTETGQSDGGSDPSEESEGSDKGAEGDSSEPAEGEEDGGESDAANGESLEASGGDGEPADSESDEVSGNSDSDATDSEADRDSDSGPSSGSVEPNDRDEDSSGPGGDSSGDPVHPGDPGQDASDRDDSRGVDEPASADPDDAEPAEPSDDSEREDSSGSGDDPFGDDEPGVAPDKRPDTVSDWLDAPPELPKPTNDSTGGDRPSRDDRAQIDTGAATEAIEVDISSDPNTSTAYSDPDDVNVEFADIVAPDERTAAERAEDEEAIRTAVLQGAWFETPARGVEGVTLHQKGDRKWPRYFEQHSVEDVHLRAPLMQMRLIFEANRRAHMQRHMKSGKINATVLGKRAALGDPRLFQKKTIPGKMDYAVFIGMDLSGSTSGRNLLIEKNAIYAQAELLHRLGIPFAIFGHTGMLSDRNMHVFPIKTLTENWDKKVSDCLMSMDSFNANLDGHMMEFLRKRADESNATHNIILYYTDGKMPAENGPEERVVLKRELEYCAKRGYTVLGVGIRTDSPKAHGLDTAQLDTLEDLPKVIKHLGKYLSKVNAQ